MKRCVWCSRMFLPREAGGKHCYQLPHAGLTICWDCSDKYEEVEIELHLGEVCGSLTSDKATVVTENGYRLPFTIGNWTKPRTRWGKASAHAVDSYGRTWTGTQSGPIIRLRPTRSQP
jgi:hypothetical protein